MNSQKKKTQGQTPAILTKQAWSIKDSLVYGFQGNFSCGTQWVVPSRQDISMSGKDELNPECGSIIFPTQSYPLCPK